MPSPDNVATGRCAAAGGGGVPADGPDGGARAQGPSWGMPERETAASARRPEPRRTGVSPAPVSPSLTARHKLPSAGGLESTPGMLGRAGGGLYPNEGGSPAGDSLMAAFAGDSSTNPDPRYDSAFQTDIPGPPGGRRVVPPSPRRRGSTAGGQGRSRPGEMPGPAARDSLVPSPGSFGRGRTNPAANAPHPAPRGGPGQQGYPPRPGSPYSSPGAPSGAAGYPPPSPGYGSPPGPPPVGSPGLRSAGSYSVPGNALPGQERGGPRRTSAYSAPGSPGSGAYAPPRRPNLGGGVPAAGFGAGEQAPPLDLPVYDPDYGADGYLPPPPPISAPERSFEEDERRDKLKRVAAIGAGVLVGLLAIIGAFNYVAMAADTARLNRALTENILSNGLPTPVLPIELGQAIDELGIAGQLVERYSEISGKDNVFRAGVRVKHSIAFIPRTYTVEREGTFVVSDQLATLSVYVQSGWDVDRDAEEMMSRRKRSNR